MMCFSNTILIIRHADITRYVMCCCCVVVLYNKVHVMCCCCCCCSFPFTISKLLSFFPFSLKHWHATVYPGNWTTTDEIGVAGWYHSVTTIIGLNHYLSQAQTDLYLCYSSQYHSRISLHIQVVI